MRTKFAMILGMAALLAMPAIGRAADDAVAIIDKAIKAHGGADKLNKNKAMEWKVTGSLNFMDQKVAYNGTYYFQQPDMMRFDIDLDFGGQKIELKVVLDGKNAWESAMGMTREITDKKLEASKHNIYVISLSQLTPLKEKGYTLTTAGEMKIKDNPALGVKVVHKDHPDVTLYFDKETGLLVLSETMIWHEFTDKVVKQETYFLDYKEVKGDKIFQKLVIKRDGKDFIEEELSGQKSMEKFDAKVFAKPE